MAPLFFVVAILGCGDGATACRDVRLLPTRYASVETCRAALPNALALNTDVLSPTISAACRPYGVQFAKNGTTAMHRS